MYTVGEVIKHKTLGEGVIKEIQEREWINGVPDSPILVITFSEHPRIVQEETTTPTKTIVKRYESCDYNFTEHSLKRFLVTE